MRARRAGPLPLASVNPSLSHSEQVVLHGERGLRPAREVGDHEGGVRRAAHRGDPLRRDVTPLAWGESALAVRPGLTGHSF